MATKSAPMVVAAPGLFSITTGWPQRSESFWPTVRATTSVAPPAGKGTISRTGFAGYVCACAASVVLMPRAIATVSVQFCIERAIRFPLKLER